MGRLGTEKVNVVSLGLEEFTPALDDTGTTYVHLDWKPPAQGKEKLTDLLFRLSLAPEDGNGQTAIERANDEAAKRIMDGQPVLIGVKPAHEVVPGMEKKTIFHAGPPVAWKDMCGPMRGAFLGALIYEGLAADYDEAEKLMDSGAISYDSNHLHDAVGPMTGLISYSMPVFVVENQTFGNRAYCTINEGIGKVMRFGANSAEVIQRLKWIEKVFAPLLDETLQKAGGVNLKNVMAQALAMGDEMHQRNVAASLNFFKQICVPFTEIIKTDPNGVEVMEFLVKKNEQFFLNLAMAGSKALADPARNIPHSTVVTAMSRNGVEFGLNISALGYEWFNAPCKMPQAMYFPGFSEKDANPDMGDSTIVECAGIGGFAMGCAPAVVNFVGAGSVSVAYDYSMKMGEITVARNANLPMPNLDFAGAATGIDIMKVVATGILPVINTGVAHRGARRRTGGGRYRHSAD